MSRVGARSYEVLPYTRTFNVTELKVAQQLQHTAEYQASLAVFLIALLEMYKIYTMLLS